MDKAKIRLVTIGHLPLHLNLRQVSAWRSEVFELVGEIENFDLRCDSDGPEWEFSDNLLKEQIPSCDGADFILAIVNVPIEENWYSRRLGDNKIVLTFNQIREFLDCENIPLENAILRVLYAYTLAFRSSGNRIPGLNESQGFTHDETRGCLFDMNGIKSDLVESCNKPIVCGECEQRLRKGRVSDQVIKATQKEIRKIRKHRYYRIFDFVKSKPLTALFISSVFAIILGITGSLIASFIYDGIKVSFSAGTTNQFRQVTPADRLKRPADSQH